MDRDNHNVGDSSSARVTGGIEVIKDLVVYTIIIGFLEDRLKEVIHT